MPENLCLNCGANIPPNIPGGHCPRCLLYRGLDSDPPGLDRDSDDRTLDYSARPGSVLDTLSASFGAVPRVILRDTAIGEESSPVILTSAGHDTSTRYRIDGEIARGGMGEVLKGRDPDLGRDVAIKVLREDLRKNGDLVRRFVEEAQISGQLQHPGVVPIYELGTFADKRPFFCMKLVKGRTLAEVMAERSAPSSDHPRLLAIFLDVAQTMAYTHARGVIHRDLKPSNVMVGSFGEVQVVDWGLAKVLPRGGMVEDREAGKMEVHETVIATARSGSDSDSDLSRAGSVLGTPSYMSPEQARGENDRVDERADVFAMGSILCEILTGMPAFVGRSTGEILRQSARGDVAGVLKRLDGCGADAELVSLARDTLAPEADDRPRDARVIVDRLQKYHSGVQERLRAAELARAAESARAEEAKRTAEAAEARARAERRSRRLTLALAASILGLVSLGGLGAALYSQQRQARAAEADRFLGEAETLLARAVEKPEEISRWREAMSAAGRVDSSQLVAPALDSRLSRIKADAGLGLASSEGDATLRQALVEIRSKVRDVGLTESEAACAGAFRDAGFDIEALGVAEAASRLRKRSPAVVVELAAGLDYWYALRMDLGRPVVDRRKPMEVARAADPDEFRNRIRTILLSDDVESQADDLKALSADAHSAELPAPTALLLTASLRDPADRIALLRKVVSRHPDDVWLNFSLASVLTVIRPSPREEVIRYYTAARSLRPETALNLALLLEQIKPSEEAEAIYRDLVARRPKSIDFLANFVVCLRIQGKSAEADVALAAALNERENDLDPQQYSSRIHDALGTVSRSREKSDDAIAEYRKAIRLDPGNYLAHLNLGSVLNAQNKRDEAILEYFESVRRNPDNRTALSNLVNYLLYKSQPELAIGVCREMIRVRPDFAPAYHFLGMASNRARRPEAIAAGRIEAIKAWREAVRLDPTDRIVWYWLGVQLNVAGEFASSVDALRRAVEMAGEPIPPDAAPMLARTQAYLKMEPRLPAVLKGEARPKDASETILYARMCRSLKRYATSVRFLEEAFADDPSLIEDQDCGRIYAAKCAVLAGCGQGKDDPPLDEPARARLRKKGLNWLREELAKGRTLVEKDPKLLPGPRGKRHSRADAFSELRQKFVGGSSYRDLNEVRYPEGLAKLPDAEREEWQAFWAEVEALVKGAPGTKL